MKLDEFRQRWIRSETPPAATGADHARTGPVDGRASPTEDPQAVSPLRFRARYVPAAADGSGGGAFLRVMFRTVIIGLMFVIAVVGLKLTFDYLPTYLATYVFDR